MKKIIATDVDFVLLDWVQGLKPFLDEKGIDSEHLKKYKGSTYYPSLQELFFIKDESICINLMKEFNASRHIKELPIFQEGSEKYFRELHDKGFEIHAVTCIGSEEKIKRNRYENLFSIYGEVFSYDKVINLPVRTSKEPYLKELQKKGEVLIYIDDRHNHLKEAKDIGIKTALYTNDGKIKDDNTDVVITCLSEISDHVKMVKQIKNKKNRFKV